MRFSKSLILPLALASFVLGIHAEEATADGNRKQVIRLNGTGIARVPNTSIGEPADANWCFDVDIEDVRKGKSVGTGTDCLEVIGVADNGGLEIIGTTLFHFKNGTLVSQGETTVQPVLHGSPNVTHITGAVPDPSDNSILFGTGKYAGATGPVRLSGAVDMSAFGGNFGDPITFDCLFVIDVDTDTDDDD